MQTGRRFRCNNHVIQTEHFMLDELATFKIASGPMVARGSLQSLFDPAWATCASLLGGSDGTKRGVRRATMDLVIRRRHR